MGGIGERGLGTGGHGSFGLPAETIKKGDGDTCGKTTPHHTPGGQKRT